MARAKGRLMLPVRHDAQKSLSLCRAGVKLFFFRTVLTEHSRCIVAQRSSDRRETAAALQLGSFNPALPPIRLDSSAVPPNAARPPTLRDLSPIGPSKSHRRASRPKRPDRRGDSKQATRREKPGRSRGPAGTNSATEQKSRHQVALMNSYRSKPSKRWFEQRWRTRRSARSRVPKGKRESRPRCSCRQLPPSTPGQETGERLAHAASRRARAGSSGGHAAPAGSSCRKRCEASKKRRVRNASSSVRSTFGVDSLCAEGKGAEENPLLDLFAEPSTPCLGVQ